MPNNLLLKPVLGAEARIELVDWFGKTAVRKLRAPKSYRNQELDRYLRAKRTKEEVEILHAAKLVGVDCPEVYFADPETSEIIMEYVDGTLLSDYQLASPLRNSARAIRFSTLGRYAARLHSRGIVHGDLTTRNVIVADKERLVLIDFGLSFVSDRLEDRAEDLHLLKQALKSSESVASATRDFEAMLSGYNAETGKKATEDVKNQISKIELRGRYARVD